MKQLLLILLLFSHQGHSLPSAEDLFQRLLKLVLPESLEIKWDDIDLGVNLSRLKVESQNICVHDPDSGVKICAEKLNIELPYLSGFQPTPGSQVHILGIKGEIDLSSPAPQKKDSSSGLNVLSYTELLKHLRHLDLDVRVDKLTLTVDEEQEVPISFKARNKISDSSALLELSLVPLPSNWSKNHQVTLGATVQVSEKEFSLKGHFDYQQKGQKLAVRLDTSPQRFGKTLKDISLSASGVIEGEEFGSQWIAQIDKSSTSLSGSALYPSENLRLEECQLTWNLVQMGPGNSRCQLFVGEDVNGQFECRPNSSKLLKCSSKIQLLRVGFLNLEGKLPWPFQIQGVTADGQLQLNDFSGFGQLIGRYGLKIPAPFASLNGPVLADIKVRPQGKKHLHLDAELKSELKSANQVLVVKSDATLEIKNGQTKVQSETQFQETKLTLPHFELGPLPQVMPDSRFEASERSTQETTQKPETVDESPNPLLFSIAVKTKQAIFIASHIIPAPIPIGLDLHLDSKKGASGKVKIHPMDIEMFKRKATLKKLTLEIDKEIAKSEIDGLIQTKQAQYTVKIFVDGPLEKPYVRFESDPFLPEPDIISVMLFGKTRTELGDDQADSADDFQRAVSARVFSLLSLFYLSSTPIESIDYDPATNKVTAYLKLGSGRILLSQDQTGQSGIGFERRIWGSFFVRTSRTLSKDNSEVMTTIEWENRY